MPSSVQPLRLIHSFNSGRRTATDKVDASSLDEAFGLVCGKINEVIAALDETTAEDDSLADEVVDARHLSNDALDQISAMINAQVTPP